MFLRSFQFRLDAPKVVERKIFVDCWCDISTDLMSLLSPDHKCQNTEGKEASSHRRSDLEQSSAARHNRAVTSRLLHSLEDILHRTVLFIKLLSCLRSDIVILDTLIVFTYLCTYLLTY